MQYWGHYEICCGECGTVFGGSGVAAPGIAQKKGKGAVLSWVTSSSGVTIKGVACIPNQQSAATIGVAAYGKAVQHAGHTRTSATVSQHTVCKTVGTSIKHGFTIVITAAELDAAGITDVHSVTLAIIDGTGLNTGYIVTQENQFRSVDW